MGMGSAMNAATILMRIAMELTEVKRAFLTETLNRRNEWLLRLQGLVEGFAAKEKGIVSDRTLSEAGKTAALAQAATA